MVLSSAMILEVIVCEFEDTAVSGSMLLGFILVPESAILQPRCPHLTRSFSEGSELGM